MTQSTQFQNPPFTLSSPTPLELMDGDRREGRLDDHQAGFGAFRSDRVAPVEEPVTPMRERPDRLELISLMTVAGAILGFVVLVAAVIIPRPIVAPVIGIALAGVFGARLLSSTGLRPRALSGR